MRSGADKMKILILLALVVAACHGFVIRCGRCSNGPSTVIQRAVTQMAAETSTAAAKTTTTTTFPTPTTTIPSSTTTTTTFPTPTTTIPSSTTTTTTPTTTIPSSTTTSTSRIPTTTIPSSTTSSSTTTTTTTTTTPSPASPSEIPASNTSKTTATPTTTVTPAPVTTTTEASEEGVGTGVTSLAESLRRQLPACDNALLSPLSVASVMAALQMGARGKSAQQIAALLGQGSASDREYWAQLGDVLRAINSSTTVIASLANAVVVDESLSLSPIFEHDVKSILSSEAFTADFAGHAQEATDFINQWVSAKTQSKIPKMLDEPLDASTQLAVASALYFNGAWAEQFLLNSTKRAVFNVSHNESFEVDMMEQSSFALYTRDQTIGCQVLGLPYKDQAFALFLVLPNEPGVSGLASLEARLTPAVLQRLLYSASWEELPYYVPRMRLEASFNLNSALIAAGVTDIFDPLKADLSGLVSQNSSASLFVSDVLHRVVMDVTETGTEAAAATVATGSRSGSREVFSAHRPFLFVLQHRPSGMPLFRGSVVRPTPNYPLSDQ